MERVTREWPDDNRQKTPLTLNQPGQLNAPDAATIARLERQLDGLAEQGGVRCVVLTGAGDKAFAAGADTRRLETLDPEPACLKSCGLSTANSHTPTGGTAALLHVCKKQG